MIILQDAYTYPNACEILYELLKERTPNQSIFHYELPPYEKHWAFWIGKPYPHWYLIQNDDGDIVGSISLTMKKEIGIFIFDRFKHRGYATDAIKTLQQQCKYWHDTMYANINPNNQPSIEFFKQFNPKLIQLTYELRFAGEQEGA